MRSLRSSDASFELPGQRQGSISYTASLGAAQAGWVGRRQKIQGCPRRGCEGLGKAQSSSSFGDTPPWWLHLELISKEIARGVEFDHDRGTEASAAVVRSAHRVTVRHSSNDDVGRVDNVDQHLSALSIMSSPPVATKPLPVRTTPPTENVEQLKALLRKTLRVSVTDGRVFLGTFAGTDKQLNILLINTDEYRVGPDAGSDGLDGRYVGQVMIPWRLVVRVECHAGGESTRGAGYLDSDEDSMYA